MFAGLLERMLWAVVGEAGPAGRTELEYARLGRLGLRKWIRVGWEATGGM